MDYYWALFLYASIKVATGSSFSVFQSTTPLIDENNLSGLQLKVASSKLINVQRLQGFSICGRFNSQRIINGKTRLFRILDSEWRLFFFNINYDHTFVSFGNADEFGSSPSWICADGSDTNFVMWSTQRWHSVCFSFQDSKSYVSMIKVNANNFQNIGVIANGTNIGVSDTIKISWSDFSFQNVFKQTMLELF